MQGNSFTKLISLFPLELEILCSCQSRALCTVVFSESSRNKSDCQWSYLYPMEDQDIFTTSLLHSCFLCCHAMLLSTNHCLVVFLWTNIWEELCTRFHCDFMKLWNNCRSFNSWHLVRSLFSPYSHVNPWFTLGKWHTTVIIRQKFWWYRQNVLCGKNANSSCLSTIQNFLGNNNQ